MVTHYPTYEEILNENIRMRSALYEIIIAARSQGAHTGPSWLDVERLSRNAIGVVYEWNK